MLSYSELKEIAIDVKKGLGLFSKKLSNTRIEKLLNIPGTPYALQKAVEFIINDRVTKSVYAGGWSNTASKYVGVIYGEDYASSIHESMTDTALAVEALKLYEDAYQLLNKSEGFHLYDDGLKNYLTKRWNSKHGDSGTFSVKRDGPEFTGNHLRHTAMIIRIFVCLPMVRDKLRLSAEYLIKRLIEQDVNWEEEKIATSVAIYAALKRLEEYIDYIPQTDINKAKRIVIDQATARYDYDLKGWYSGTNREVSYRYYSLFLLAEMPVGWTLKGDFNNQFETAYGNLLSMITSNGEGAGISHFGISQPDIGLSSLMLRVMLQKPSLEYYEEEKLLDIMRFLIYAINGSDNKYWQYTYTWTISYFITAICEALYKTSTYQ